MEVHHHVTALDDARALLAGWEPRCQWRDPNADFPCPWIDVTHSPFMGHPFTYDPALDTSAEAILARLVAEMEGRAMQHDPVLFEPSGPVYDSLPHPKASRYELSGALYRDQSADMDNPDAYDRRILLVTVASAARALAQSEDPR